MKANLHICFVLMITFFWFSADSWASATLTAEQWDIYELALRGPTKGNPFLDVKLSAQFTCGAATLTVPGFYDGNIFNSVRAGEFNFAAPRADYLLRITAGK